MPSTTGPSTSQTPYIVGLEPNVRFTSILSAGDQVGNKANGVSPWLFVGIPDGLGAFDNGDGTITVLVNHEVSTPTVTVVREHGAAGAFVSALIVDKATLAVVDAYDLANQTYVDPEGDGWTLSPAVINRLCSADLPDISAFYDADSGLGTQERIFLNGEEFGAEGRAFAWVATGAEARTAWELPALGQFSWENAVASPDSGVKTVVIGTDDSTPGQVYVYVGDKQATGNTVEKAGLSNGLLYGIKAAGIGISSGNPATGTSENLLTPATTPTSGAFTLEVIPNAKTITGAQIEAASDAAGVAEWWRPEDGAWDTVDANRFYFVTTASFTSPSRLWALDFVDVTDPLAGGTFTMLLDGTEGQRMLDNMTVGDDGKVYVQEDAGNNVHLGRIGVYDPATDTLTWVAQHDPARFLAPVAPFTQDEEASGIIDVTDLLGDADTQAFLVDTEAHFPFPAPLTSEIQEGGQLQVMYIDAPISGGRNGDTVRGGYTDDALKGKGGDDLILGGSGKDSLNGGDGDDTVVGGQGEDDLRGGEGADMFRYDAASEGGDLIRGFVAGEDGFEISASGFGGGLVAGAALDPSRLVLGTAATQAFGQFVYDTKTGQLWWDADGTNVGLAVEIADLGGKPALTASDFDVF